MKTFALSFLFLFITTKNFAQDTTLLKFDPQSKKVYKGSVKMNMDDLFKIMRPHQESFDLIVSARDCHFFSNIFGVTGGFISGFPIGKFLVTDEFNVPLFAVGIGLIGVSVSLDFRAKKQTKRAVNSYNSSLNQTYFEKNKIDLSLVGNQNGLGLKITF